VTLSIQQIIFEANDISFLKVGLAFSYFQKQVDIAIIEVGMAD
jgi:folylpolyglutamate synthase/dihydropteroate synthase